MPQKVRIAVIGAGIIGTAITRELSKYENIDVTLIEKNPDVGWGVSKANSGILHAGFDDDPDKYPNRARLCVRGNELWHQWVNELEIPTKWSGAMIVALNEEHLKVLDALYERGQRNKVPELEIIEKDKLRKMEPNISDNAIAALFAPTEGVFLPYEATVALTENAVSNGAKLLTNTRVIDIKHNGEIRSVVTNRGVIETDFVINAAGLYGDTISKMVGIDYFTIHPRRGEYFLFDKSYGPSSNYILFPTPTPVSKGILVNFTIEGHTYIGPNAQDINDKEDTSTTRAGLSYVYEKAKLLVKKLPPRRACIRNFAGLRPEPSTGDFIIESYDTPFGFINAVGMRSPGLTSAPAVAEEIVKILRDLDVKLIPKKHFNPYRKRIVSFADLTLEEKDRLIRENPKYANVICRCEQVTEAEIIEAIKRGATTVDGIKFRTRASMGRCQGGFCLPRILKILSRELGKPIPELTKKGGNSRIVCCETKDLRCETSVAGKS